MRTTVLRLRNVVAIAICLAVTTMFASCDGDDPTKGKTYCVNTISNSPESIILPKAEMEGIKYLFNQNQLDYTKYQFYRLQKDELGYRHVRGYQFANGLMVFYSDLIFHFDENGNYSSLSGHLIGEINLDTKPLMKQDNVVEKFIDRLKQAHYYSEDAEIMDECFDIEFGYYNLNGGISYADKKYTKAWKVNRANREYPFACINDENSEIIYYDDGIRY